jgi:hypothetical protein
MAIRFEKIRFHCSAVSEIRLPDFIGSTLRGSLGWALKKCSCVLRTRTCNDCPVRDDCGYAWFFETDVYAGSDARNVNARPHPFVIEPPEDLPPLIAPGETFSFSVVLLDRAIDYLPVLIHAVSIMGDSGIGRGRTFGFGRFETATVFSGDNLVYDGAAKMLNSNRCESLLDLESFDMEEQAVCRVRFISPLRVKYGNRLHRELPFHLLIRTALRRISALEHAYQGMEPDIDYRGLIGRAEKVRVQATDVRWKEVFRYSNRQKKKISLGGMAGETKYAGDLSPYMPFLRYCEQVHLGKQTVFGLGRIQVEKDDRDNR